MDYIRQLKAIIIKDLTSEFRTKETLASLLIFTFIVITIFSFAFDPTRDVLRQVFPGIIWVAFIFAGMLGLNRSFATEKNNDCIQGLMLCSADRSLIYLAKMAGNLIFMFIMEAITLPVFFVLFDYRLQGSLLFLIIVVVLGTIGFITLGTFLAALAVNTKSSEILLPLILFPLMVPVLISAVQATSSILTGEPLGEWVSWLKVMAAFDLIYLIVPVLLFDYVMEV